MLAMIRKKSPSLVCNRKCQGDADGYDLVVVDAMHKATYASRICHSCRPNCEAKVTAVDDRYQIRICTVRKIQYGEEITLDYNSIKESKEEYEASDCLCGSQVCQGGYLNLIGEGSFLEDRTYTAYAAQDGNWIARIATLLVGEDRT
ncbi:histone-lysine N-methyltransferase ATXR3-like isoform X3 [Rosa rugosa]|uniref:histone-lysine N-methyltransferase ATXR3-like isoform X3 n=1 Tax=Rosa rugosa TaxID=74645 RepID=UPI002B412CDB|nr:histone-lysine N-methyltransferase ATXR3-like isoform X3 [Rosa rugosa]